MRTLRREIKPLADAVKAKAPYQFGDLEGNLFIGTRLTKRQRAMSRELLKPSTAELHFGTADPAGFLNEFALGPHNKDAIPFFRPEWEGRKRAIRDAIGKSLGDEIVAAGVRAARRRARGTAGKF